ncbi:hypothetical protein C8F01DRAFT_1233222 [Mycena amicta]|nr:hypothetical protein C8F01DRAFT_1233222 [Mycena amicta]
MTSDNLGRATWALNSSPILRWTVASVPSSLPRLSQLLDDAVAELRLSRFVVDAFSSQSPAKRLRSSPPSIRMARESVLGETGGAYGLGVSDSAVADSCSPSVRDLTMSCKLRTPKNHLSASLHTAPACPPSTFFLPFGYRDGQMTKRRCHVLASTDGRLLQKIVHMATSVSPARGESVSSGLGKASVTPSDYPPSTKTHPHCPCGRIHPSSHAQTSRERLSILPLGLGPIPSKPGVPNPTLSGGVPNPVRAWRAMGETAGKGNSPIRGTGLETLEERLQLRTRE